MGSLSESKWEVACYNIDDWRTLAASLDRAVSCEESLRLLVVENFLPNLPKIVEDMVSVVVRSPFVLRSFLLFDCSSFVRCHLRSFSSASDRSPVPCLRLLSPRDVCRRVEMMETGARSLVGLVGGRSASG